MVIGDGCGNSGHKNTSYSFVFVVVVVLVGTSADNVDTDRPTAVEASVVEVDGSR